MFLEIFSVTAAHRIFIGTPAYGGMVHVSFLNAITAIHSAGLPYTLMTISNESLITRARNSILSTFHARDDHSHLLFIDGDVNIEPAGIKRMLAHGKDVVGAPVALKGRRPDGSRIFNIGRSMGEEGALMQVERIGTAALMFSRTAVNALVTLAIEEGRVYEPNVFANNDGMAPIHYDIFRVGVVGGEYLSEDYWVCRELRRLGFPIFVDPAIITHHHGTMAA